MMDRKPGRDSHPPISSTEAAAQVFDVYREKRRRFRSPVELPVRIITADNCGARALVTATCTDFSEDGIAFETGAELELGEVVFLEFMMAGEPQATDRSLIRVVHRKATGYGGAFVKAEEHRC